MSIVSEKLYFIKKSPIIYERLMQSRRSSNPRPQESSAALPTKLLDQLKLIYINIILISRKFLVSCYSHFKLSLLGKNRNVTKIDKEILFLYLNKNDIFIK